MFSRVFLPHGGKLSFPRSRDTSSFSLRVMIIGTKVQVVALYPATLSVPSVCPVSSCPQARRVHACALGKCLERWLTALA